MATVSGSLWVLLHHTAPGPWFPREFHRSIIIIDSRFLDTNFIHTKKNTSCWHYLCRWKPLPLPPFTSSSSTRRTKLRRAPLKRGVICAIPAPRECKCSDRHGNHQYVQPSPSNLHWLWTDHHKLCSEVAGAMLTPESIDARTTRR